MKTKEEKPDWLAVSLGKTDSPKPPELGSERIKGFLSRALLEPGSLTPHEVQELAASVLSHLIKRKNR